MKLFSYRCPNQCAQAAALRQNPNATLAAQTKKNHANIDALYNVYFRLYLYSKLRLTQIRKWSHYTYSLIRRKCKGNARKFYNQSVISKSYIWRKKISMPAAYPAIYKKQILVSERYSNFKVFFIWHNKKVHKYEHYAQGIHRRSRVCENRVNSTGADLRLWKLVHGVCWF